MKLVMHRVALPLEHEFRIARGSRTRQHSLMIELSDGGYTGLGEVTANPYYGQSLAGVEAAIGTVRDLIEGYQFGTPEALWGLLFDRIPEHPFALSAVDLAAHDLFARQQGLALIDLWELDRTKAPHSSYTLGIGSRAEMVSRLQARPDWPCYKIKLGTDHDIALVRALRAETDAVFRVDANCGWTVTEAIENSRTLKDLGVEFIEQPLPAEAPRDDHQRVFDRSALPVVADESCLVEEDVAACRGLFDGVNIKLSKCGGLTPALRMLRQARELGLGTMLGCMVESSIGISAAAHLLPLLDHADLDGAVLLRDEPAEGVTLRSGRVEFVDSPGTGARLHHERLSEFAIR